MKKRILLNIMLIDSSSMIVQQPMSQKSMIMMQQQTPTIQITKYGWSWFLENIFYPIFAITLILVLIEIDFRLKDLYRIKNNTEKYNNNR